jgi:ubiquinone/menaquinone biosynthesis C-methylase UbiE
VTENVTRHYFGGSGLAKAIAQRLRAAGKDLATLTAADLATVDEFHIRGRQATLELAARMRLTQESRVLDIGSGLGGPARTVAATHGCHVIGIDLTEEFCQAAQAMTEWVGLGDRTAFRQGDALDLPFEAGHFDAAMTIHAAMNIAAKDVLYANAKRVLKPGGIFAVYDVLQGEGGEACYPVPWAREPSISHLATPEEMQALLTGAGFRILEVEDSTERSHAWFAGVAAQLERAGPPTVSIDIFLGDDRPAMTHNQVRNLGERRIRTVSYICQA